MREHVGVLRVLRWSRWLGAAAALASVSLWAVFVCFNPFVGLGVSSGSYAVAAVMVAVALLALWAALSFRPGWLCAAFAASFVPVGFYLLLVSGIFKWVGIANLLYLVAALGLLAHNRIRVGNRSQGDVSRL